MGVILESLHGLSYLRNTITNLNNRKMNIVKIKNQIVEFNNVLPGEAFELADGSGTFIKVECSDHSHLSYNQAVNLQTGHLLRMPKNEKVKNIGKFEVREVK